MTRIKQLVRPETQVVSWKAAFPVLAIAAACLAGCAGTTPNINSVEPKVGLDKPLVQFNTCAKPIYPQESRARGAQGTTTLSFLIDTDGSVVESLVAKSSGYPLLDETARAAIAKCRFRPAMAGDTPKRAWVPVQYVWSLR